MLPYSNIINRKKVNMSIDKLIGNTPMIKIIAKFKDKKVNVFAKLEYYNYTGSIKDRIAYYILNEAYNDGSLKKNMPIVEAIRCILRA